MLGILAQISKTRLRTTRLKGFVFPVAQVVSLTLILYGSTMRGECVLNIYVDKELFPERFLQVLKS